MTAKDQYKLLVAGFTIIRVMELNTNGVKSWVIKYKTPHHTEWRVLQHKINSEAMLNGCLKETLKSPTTVQE